eukprot:521448-Amorphochlora_amoeboformis.AAC.1
MDYGYPQTTDAKGLIEFINQEANQVKLQTNSIDPPVDPLGTKVKPKEIPPGVTGELYYIHT